MRLRTPSAGHEAAPLSRKLVSNSNLGAVMPSQVSSQHDLDREVEELRRELSEAHRREAATAEVLEVISRSAFDLQGVLDGLIESAVRLTDAELGLIYRQDGDFYRAAAIYGASIELIEVVKKNPIPPTRQSATGRAVLQRRVIHIEDVVDDPEYTWAGLQGAQVRTILAVPMLREDTVIGVIVTRRTRVQAFTDQQIELVTNFARQAVIAIENTRLFEAEQTRARELTNALEQQRATGEILAAISGSITDAKPVFDTIVRNMLHLFGTQRGVVQILKNGMVHLAAAADDLEFETHAAHYPQPLDENSGGGRAMITKQVVQFAPVLDNPSAPAVAQRIARSLGFNSMIMAPMIRGNTVIGAIGTSRREPKPFDDKQVALIKTFADQAVIAIENARLFEEISQKSRDLEIASQHKSQFVANMSHELRTPLAAILGYAELMQEGFYEPQGPRSLDALTRIRSNGKHLLGLINTVLDIAKIESGQFTLNMAEYAIENVVETVRSATEALAQSKKLSLTTDVAKSLPVGLGDEQRLTQVLLNLVGNAIKFTDTGEILIAAKAVNGHFAVSVRDTGPGIPQGDQGRIFEHFHQVDSSLTKAKGGTGLGLAIAKEIVEMHGGRIWVESTVGKGSKFQMDIPMRAEFRKLAL